MDILACTDKNYIMPCGVMMRSLCENNINEHIVFHLIVDENVDKRCKNKLQQCLVGDSTIHFYHFDNSILKKYAIDQGHHLTIAAYYRLFICDILPQNINRIIYLDCDLIVRHSLKKLWNTNLTNKALGAVTDMGEALPERYSRLNYPPSLGYFNSGVLLINLAYWREHKLQDVFWKYMEENIRKLKQHDQDVLNYICRNSKVNLPFIYNSQDGFGYNKVFFDVKKYARELPDALTAPVILHFTANKPWEKECDHPYKSEFFKYQKLTPWKEMPLVSAKIPLTRKQKLVRFLRMIGLIKPRYKILTKELM